MVFGTDGIRGFVNKYPMLPEILTRIGMILSQIISPNVKAPKALIAKDTRLSGYMIEPALVAGLIASGVDVILIGPMPTNATSMLIPSLRCDFGIMITASHNPYYDNGLKIFDCEGYKISNTVEEKINEILSSFEGEECNKESNLHRYKEYLADTLGRATRLEDVHGRYVEHIKTSFPKQYNLHGMRIVIDCANGASYKIAPMILWELGAEVISLGCEPNGLNINDNCGSVHPNAMAEKVIETRADIGIALDGDGDRVTICDENGKIIDGNLIIGCLLKYLLQTSQLENKAIVTTEIVNTGLLNYAKQLNVNVFQTKVGDRNVISKMREENVILGAEPSGHIILRNYTNSSDGIIASLQILAAKIFSRSTVSQMMSSFELLPSVSLSIPLIGKNSSIIEEIQQVVEELRREYEEAKIIVRKSGTENVVRIMIEASQESVVEVIYYEINRLYNTISH